MNYKAQVLKTLQSATPALRVACSVNIAIQQQINVQVLQRRWVGGEERFKYTTAQVLKTALQSGAPHLRMACSAIQRPIQVQGCSWIG
jgi:hypothetical protein